jgi:D-inositol-3-phosphate glycosyltransferase
LGCPRVLILTAYYFPFQGGTETHARTVASHLAAQGCAPLVLTKRDDRHSPDSEDIDGVPVRRIAPAGPRSGLRKWAMLPGAVLVMVRLRKTFDLIYCPGYQGLGLAAVVAGWLLKRPVVLRSGNVGVLVGNQWDAPLARWHVSGSAWPVRLLKSAFRRSYSRADAMLCNCRENETEALDNGVPRARVHYIPNGVDITRFRPPAAEEVAEVRRRHGWPLEKFIWLYVGRLSLEKGVMDLLDAWRLLGDATGVLVLVGPDMHGHPLDAGPAVRQFIRDHGLQDRVILHGESSAPEELLRAADAYVQPSHYESFSNALIEAMATGLPVVASRVGGMLDCIVDGENGLFCAPQDPPDLARAMRALRADPGQAARLGANARTTIVQDFDERVILRRLLAVLTDTHQRYRR